MTVVLAVLLLLALIALGVVTVLWRAIALHNTDQARRIRHQCERIEGYRAELERERRLVDDLAADLDDLSIAGPPPTACAALTPDDPSLLPAEVEQWLRTRES